MFGEGRACEVERKLLLWTQDSGRWPYRDAAKVGRKSLRVDTWRTSGRRKDAGDGGGVGARGASVQGESTGAGSCVEMPGRNSRRGGTSGG